MSEGAIFLLLTVTPGHEGLAWCNADFSGGGNAAIESLDSDRFAALCIAVKRAANEREKVNGYRVKLEES